MDSHALEDAGYIAVILSEKRPYQLGVSRAKIIGDFLHAAKIDTISA
ncbi:MAG: hypothetical protein R2861_14945 [Desulfobacterales bacterium]